MNFLQYKKQAEQDGMEVTPKTKKVDIDAFYANKEVKPVEEVKEVKKEVKPTKCNHNWVMRCMQAVRGPAPRDEEGKILRGHDGLEVKGVISYKFKYECSNCGDVELRDN